MKRVMVIAWREYVSYAKTVGFWLSILLLPLGAVVGGFLPGLMEGAQQGRTLTIIDTTGGAGSARMAALIERDYARDVRRALAAAATITSGPEAAEAVRDAFDRGGEPAARAELARRSPAAAEGFRPPKRGVVVVAPPADIARAGSPEAITAALRPYLSEERTLADGRELDAAAVLRRENGEVAVDLVTSRIDDDTTEDVVRDALETLTREDRLRRSGIDPQVVEQLDQLRPTIRVMSPRAAGGGEVSLRDRLPMLVSFVLGMVLWSAVMTGAGILMNGVIEEKSSRVLEVLLSSADSSEILAGKVLGVAALTATVMGSWFLMGAVAMSNFVPGLAGDLFSVMTRDGLVLYFALYLIGGYLMYAALFAAIGAFCETTRDAQALLGPVMILLAIPVIFMSMALRAPDAPLLRGLSWFPPFTPFLMTARAASEPPLWEVLATLVLMALTAALVVWIAGRAFRAGALSTGKLSWSGVLARLRGAER